MDLSDRYKLYYRQIGNGSFSNVYLGLDKISNIYVAIKRIDLKLLAKTNKLIFTNIMREIEIIKKLNHKNIVKYYDTIKTEDYWYIVTEYCNSGTLEDVINNLSLFLKDGEREKIIHYYLTQIKDALNYIHSMDFIHRDIKPSNILLHDNKHRQLFQSIDYNYHKNFIVKIADFGLSTYNTENNLKSTMCGTPLYMSPELLNNDKYNSDVDLWSFGVILYRMLFDKFPFNASNIDNLKYNVSNEAIVYDENKIYSKECLDLLAILLEKDQEKRITWEIFSRHEWFEKFDELESIDMYVNKIDTSNLTKTIVPQYIIDSIKSEINYQISEPIAITNKKY